MLTLSTFCYSASLNDEENARLWQEVALRYQQILCKEYKMLNLPIYPLQSGGMYLYYVPVVINGESTQQNSGIDHKQHRDAYRNFKEVVGGKDGIGESRMGEEQFKGKIQPVERVSLYARRGSLNNKSEEIGYDLDFHHSIRNDSHSPSINTEQNLSTAEKLVYEKTEEGHNTEQLEKLSAKIKSEGKDGDLSTNEHFLDSIEEPNERFIRVFKGFTIEYHPMTHDFTTNTTADAFQSGEKEVKRNDLRNSLTTQEEELRRLKLQHLMRDVSPRRSTKDVTSKSFCVDKSPNVLDGNIPCLTSSLPSDGIVKRLPRKQKLSYRIHPVSNDESDKNVADLKRKRWRVKSINNMGVNLKAMGKRQNISSNPRNRKSNEMIKSILHHKHVKSLCKTRTLPNDRLNRKKKELDSKRRPQSRSKIVKEPSRKGYELWIKRVWKKLKNQAGNNPGATLPHNSITQDEFLSTFGLVRKEKIIETDIARGKRH